MLNDNTSLVRSSFLSIRKEEDNAYKIAHVISGRQFRVDHSTIEVLDYFKQPQNLSDIECDDNFRLSLEQLVTGGLLVDVGKRMEETFQVQNPEPAFFGFQPYKAETDDQTQRIVMVGVPFGGGNSVSSKASRFPYALRRFAQMRNLNLKPTAQVNYKSLGNGGHVHHLPQLIQNAFVRDGGDAFIHHFEASKQVYDKIRYIFQQIVRKQHIPFAIGGDHSISLPVIQSVAEVHDNIHILHFDAHTDTYSSPYEPILDQAGSHHHGNFLSKCLRMEQVQKVTHFGIRGLNNAFIQEESSKQKIYWADELKNLLRSDETDFALPDDQNYYLSFNIDVLDPSVAPGTATPLPNGLSFEEVMLLFQKLKLHEKRIVGLDFVEVNVSRDVYDLTIGIATQIILNMLNSVKI